MKISVITITFNAVKYLENTMLSVLNQTCSDFEYIIVDGASTDGTLDMIKKYAGKIANGEFPCITSEQFRWISEPDKGLYDAMNKGQKMAEGDFVWFMNAGDKVYDNQTVSRIVNAYQSHPDCDVIYSQAVVIDENDKVLGERHKIAPQNLTKKSLLNGLVVSHQAILVRKNIALPYDLQYHISADYDWVCNALEKSKENIYIDGYFARFMTAGTSSVNRKQSWTERYQIMKKHFGAFSTLWAHAKIVLKYPFTRKY